MALAIVMTLQEIKDFHGRAVKIIGTHKIEDTGKGPRNIPVSQVVIQDGTRVILAYGPKALEHEDMNGHTVAVIGTILRTCPDEERQYIVGPHMVDIQVFEEQCE